MTSAAAPSISLDAAIAMTGLSKRTLWRRIEQGSLTKLAADSRGRALLAFEEIRPLIDLELDDEGVDMIARADGGDALAQAEAGALFALEYQQAIVDINAYNPEIRKSGNPEIRKSGNPEIHSRPVLA